MRTILLALGFALALTVPASAQDCVVTTSEADVTIGVRLAATIYGDDVTSCSSYTLEGCQAGACVPGVGCVESAGWLMWWYEEANGMPGLQRADESHDDTCGNRVLGDNIIY